jgi:acyl-CoA synthetase (AMP-forming)/AMP-acid ligase II
MKTIEEVLISLPDLSVIVRGKFQANDSLQSVFQFDELLGATELAWPRDASIHRSPAMICFSSGTSGFPKGVILTHRNLVAMQHMYYYATHHAARMQNGGKLHNTVLNVFPPFHSGGVVGSIIDPIYDGSTSVVMQQFQFDKFLDMIEKYRPTNIMLAPPVVLLLATHSLVQGRDFSSVKRITAGAAPLSKELAEACVKRLNSSIRLNQTVRIANA